MNDNINKTLEQLHKIFVSVEEILTAWTEPGNLQVSTLLRKLAVKMNFDEKQIHHIDPFVRFYINNNTNYSIVRGAHGGITRIVDQQKKESMRLAKETVKKTMTDMLEAKINILATSDIAPQVENLKEDQFTEDYILEENSDSSE